MHSGQQDEVDLHAGAQAKFNVLSARDPAKDFVPLVLKSVSSSMGRSPTKRDGGAQKLGEEVPSNITHTVR